MKGKDFESPEWVAMMQIDPECLGCSIKCEPESPCRKADWAIVCPGQPEKEG